MLQPLFREYVPAGDTGYGSSFSAGGFLQIREDGSMYMCFCLPIWVPSLLQGAVPAAGTE